ncbi:Ger(x)C family spore germination protein [Paenibacillus ferrarius]|uniref:Ger(x)C family spore germination protein n=1 Tax=Paenibacillus ferrarius TaxID=1469647 RepID=UPI003D2E0620
MLKIAFSLFLIILLSGCWSSKEIETQSLYIGMALDGEWGDKTEEAMNHRGGNYQKKNTITSTIQLVAMESSSTSSAPSSLGEGPKKPYRNVVISGDSIIEIIREASLQLDKPIIGHHLKVIVIGRKLAESVGVDQLVDFYLRDNDIRMSSIVFVSKGKASDVIQSGASGDIPSIHLEGISNNQFRTIKILPAQTLARLNGHLQAGENFLLQNAIAANGEMKLSGAGVFDGTTRTLKGFLNEDEVGSLIWLNGLGKGGVLKIYHPQSGKAMTYEIKSMRSKIKSSLSSDGRVVFEVRIQSCGRWIEDWKDATHPQGGIDREEAEKLFSEAVKEGVEQLLDKLQNTLKIDGAGLGERLRIQHPVVWGRLKPDWNNEFSQATIRIEVETKIEDYGTKNASR